MAVDPKPLVDPEEQKKPAAKAEGASVTAFKGNVFLAMRTSAVVVLFSLLIFVPKWNNAISANKAWAPYLGYLGGGSCLMVVYTVYQNYGNTAQLFFQGMMGTFGACMWITVMSAIMPNGAGGDHYYAPLAHACHIGFVIIVMWLNFSKNVRVFILSYHVYFAMAFMDPSTAPGTYNTSWAFDFDSQATTTMLTALAGLFGAVAVVWFPVPILAKRAASSAAKGTTSQVCSLMEDLVAYYCRSAPSVVIAQKEVEAMNLRSGVDSMQATIDSSWWETLDLMSGGARRQLLGRHVTMMTTMCDNIFAMQICMAKEDFGKTHTACMGRIIAPINALMAATRDLLTRATDAAADGSIDAGEQEAIEQCIVSTRTAIETLGQSFNKTRKLMFPDKVINMDLQAESFFVYCLSAYARHAAEYSYLMIHKPPPKASIIRELKEAFWGIFDQQVLMARLDVHAFTIRGSISILACYYVGMYWIGYNAVASGTVSLLIADFAGSALQKNMGRIQAVVIGSVCPHILYMVMGTSCNTEFIVVRVLVLFFFESVTVYIYYASPAFGHIGLLAAALALSTLIYPCGPEPTELDEQAFGVASFVKMTQTVLGVMIMTCVDMFLSAERASDGAQNAFLRGLMTIDVWFQSAFLERLVDGGCSEENRRGMKCRADIANDHTHAKGSVKNFHGARQPGIVMKHLNLAMSLGKEADLEPRYQRAAWPTDFFDFQCRRALALRANLNVIEQVLHGTRRKGMQAYPVLGRITSTASWKSLANDVENTMGNCIMMTQAILENETGKPMEHLKNKLKDLEGADKLESMGDMFVAINKSGLKYPIDTSIKTIEDDEICRLNVLLMLFDSNVEKVADMMKECLKMLN